MKRHFERKRICADRNNVALTDEMRDRVLENYEYHIPKETTMQQNTNNFNMMLGILNSTETVDKLKLINDHQKKSIIDIEDDLEKRYEYLVKRLENNDMTYGYLLKMDDLFNIVNTCTLREQGDPEHFNVFFDKVINRLKLLRGRNWETYIEDYGIKLLISLIKSYYLDTYEIYLIKNLHSTSSAKVNRWQLKDHLIIYYKFLATFDLEPHIANLDDDEVMGYQLVGDRQDFLSSTYQKLYNDEKKDLKESGIKVTKKKIINIVRDNSVQNSKNLDKTIIDLLKIDESFRKELLKTRQVVSGQSLLQG